MATRVTAEGTLSLVNSKLSSHTLESKIDLGDAVVCIRRDGMLDVFKLLKEDRDLKFDFFVSVTAVDWMDSRESRFEVVYHLLSTGILHRLRIKIAVAEANPEVDSLCSLWPGANFMEREVWDMFGIKFKGHSDLRRILMYDEFVGHPLRKDYPVQGKQPRIPMLSPEVRNTAVDMQRPALIRINKRDETVGSKGSQQGLNN